MPDDKIEKPLRLGVKKFGVAAKLEEARKQGVDPTKNANPNEVPNKLALVFDDSGSMAGDPIVQAKKAVDYFLQNCNPRDTSIALYPLNAEVRPLTCDYSLVGMVKETLNATNGTPLYEVLDKAITNEKLSRVIAFSDGSPNHCYEKEGIINKYIAAKIPIDTILISPGAVPGDTAYEELRRLAERTGGIFCKFDDIKSLGSALKYLAPAFRAMLMNPEVKAKLERGELK